MQIAEEKSARLSVPIDKKSAGLSVSFKKTSARLSVPLGKKGPGESGLFWVNWTTFFLKVDDLFRKWATFLKVDDL